MNYVIVNGVNSNTLNGLLISELPPISKPKMRVETTEIDGRDGDINDQLGYQAYEKNMKIGLYGNYDINAIIEFFGSGKTIVFSNEPDKIYNVEVIDSIDFERLVLFRIADVKFHVQPFKYLLNEQPVELDIDTETSLIVNNVGLEKSKPIITLYGSGVVEIQINTVAAFQINIDDSYVTVNSMIEEAYKDNISTLKNRQMTGEFPILSVGENTITWTGNLTKIVVEPHSRWL
ncbi:hypothetical protein FACS189465_2930 [Clostridia bacterium]|nr:hypothetical protein FACS189465_2930 [Clostridia bacterium]